FFLSQSVQPAAIPEEFIMQQRALMPAFLLTLFFVIAAQSQEKSFEALFDGKTLDGWIVREGKAIYRVEDGMIVGQTVEGSANTFLCTRKEYGEFELVFDVKCDKALNSGVQIRSHIYEKETVVPGDPKKRVRKAGDVYGYQVEIAADGN